MGFSFSDVVSTVSRVAGNVAGFASNPLGTTTSEVGRITGDLKDTLLTAREDISSEAARVDRTVSEAWKYTKSYTTSTLHDVGITDRNFALVTAGALIGSGVGFFAGASILGGVIGGATFALSADNNTNIPGLKEIDSFFDGISGVKNDEQAKIAELSNTLEAINNEYSDERDRLIAFDEIFFMALKNTYGSKIAGKQAELEAMIAQYEDYYGWIDNLPGTFLGKIAYTVISIAGGLSSTIRGAAEGNWADIKQVISISIQVAIIVLLLLIPEPGLSKTAAFTMMAALVHQLQVTYANSALTRVVFELLDVTFDVTDLNKAIPELDHFDKDSSYYEELIGYANIGVTVSFALALLAMGSAGAFDGMGAQVSAILGGTPTGELGTLYSAYNQAMVANDIVTAITTRGQLEAKLKERRDQLEAKQAELRRRQVLSQARDLEYILEGYESMVTGNFLSDEEVGVMDPEGMIPFNTRFRPSKEVDFGFEDVFTMFDESTFYSKATYGTF